MSNLIHFPKHPLSHATRTVHYTFAAGSLSYDELQNLQEGLSHSDQERYLKFLAETYTVNEGPDIIDDDDSDSDDDDPL